MAFCNKYAAALIGLLLVGIFAQAQVLTPINGYGQRHKRFAVDTLFAPPGDTLLPPAGLRTRVWKASIDSVDYNWSPARQKWVKVSGNGGGVTDTLSANPVLETIIIGTSLYDRLLSGDTVLRGAVGGGGTSLSYPYTTRKYLNGYGNFPTLNSDSLTEGSTNLFFTNARVRAALSAGTGISYNSTTGIISSTITQYTDALARVALSGTAPLTYNSSTGAFGITQATTSTDGYLSSTDWNTFNGKQAALSGTGLVKSTGGTISYITDNSSNWNTAYGWGNHALAGYLTAETDPYAIAKSGTTSLTGNVTVDGGSSRYFRLTNARFQETKGANVAAANDLTLGSDGNVFTITGNTQINAILTTNWQAGSRIDLLFTGTPKLKHNTTGGAGTSPLDLAGDVDWTAAAGDAITLLYTGTAWMETTRKIAGVNGAKGSVTQFVFTNANGFTGTVSNSTTTPTLSLVLQNATTSQSGQLTSTDWNTFNNKQNAITLTTTGSSGAATLVGSTLNIPQYSGGAGTVTGGSITWPGTIYSTPTTGTVSSGTLTFAPSLASQSAYTVFGNHTSGSATPTFGKLPVNSIDATGTPSSTTYLRGDGSWQTISAGGGGQADSAYFWQLDGNAPAFGKFLGTTNSRSLRFRTNNIERAVIDSSTGNMGVGMSPTTRTLSLAASLLIGTAETNTDYVRLLASNGSGDPEITMFNNGVITATVSANVNGFNLSNTLNVTGSVLASSLVRGSGLIAGPSTSYSPTTGELLILPNSGSAGWITFMEAAVDYHWAVGTPAGGASADLVFKSNPSGANTFTGTERMRLTKINGNLLLGTSAEDTTAIFKINQTTTTYMRGAENAPPMTTAQRLVKSTGLWRTVVGNIAAGSGYTNGTYTSVSLTGGTGSGAVATIVVAGGLVTTVTITSPGTGYVVGDVLAASIAGGSGFSYTLNKWNFYVHENEEVFDTDTHKRYVWDGTAWQALW